MQPVLLNKLTSLAFFFLSTTLLGTALATNYWISRSTPWGPVYEGLWTACTRLGCASLQRGLLYDIVVDGFLVFGTTLGATCTALYTIHLVFKGKNWWIKNTARSALLSAVVTMIGMSVYTGTFTSDVPTADRGWSFYLAWGSVMFFLAAALSSFHVLSMIAEEERDGTPNREIILLD